MSPTANGLESHILQYDILRYHFHSPLIVLPLHCLPSPSPSPSPHRRRVYHPQIRSPASSSRREDLCLPTDGARNAAIPTSPPPQVLAHPPPPLLPFPRADGGQGADLVSTGFSALATVRLLESSTVRYSPPVRASVEVGSPAPAGWPCPESPGVAGAPSQLNLRDRNFCRRSLLPGRSPASYRFRASPMPPHLHKVHQFPLISTLQEIPSIR
jgi:hypothetical protein